MQPAVKRILAVGFLYRVATAMGPLAILITLTQQHSLEMASYALTCWTLASAFTQPLWVSVAQRFGYVTTSLLLGVATGCTHAAICISPNAATSIIAAILAGATLPPITVQGRATLAAILKGKELAAAYNAESALASSAFVVAPGLIAFAAWVGQTSPLVASAFLLSFVSFLAVTLPLPQTISFHKQSSDKTPMRWTSATILAAGAAAYATLACIEVAAIAVFKDSEAAIVLAAWSAVSLVSGAALSKLRGAATSIQRILLPVPSFCCLGMAALFGEYPVALVCRFVFSGSAVAPTLALVTSEVARTTLFAHQSRTFAWLQTSTWSGAALATSVAGIIASSSVPHLFLFASVCSMLYVALLAASAIYLPTAHSRQPDPTLSSVG